VNRDAIADLQKVALAPRSLSSLGNVGGAAATASGYGAHRLAFRTTESIPNTDAGWVQSAGNRKG
jgi:hypothetical protein